MLDESPSRTEAVAAHRGCSEVDLRQSEQLRTWVCSRVRMRCEPKQWARTVLPALPTPAAFLALEQCLATLQAVAPNEGLTTLVGSGLLSLDRSGSSSSSSPWGLLLRRRFIEADGKGL